MWIYEKKLQYPIRIKNPDPRMAQVILTQYGGPDGKCLSRYRHKRPEHHAENGSCAQGNAGLSVI